MQGGWLSMQVPAQRRGLHETLISLETSSDVPANFQKWEEAQPKNLHGVQLKLTVSALLSQSGSILVIYEWFSCIRTVFRART